MKIIQMETRVGNEKINKRKCEVWQKFMFTLNCMNEK